MSEVEREQKKMYLPTPTFTTIEEGPLSDGKWLTHPLIVRIEEDDGEVLVSEPDFYIHAAGPTIPQAIDEFKRIIVDELEELSYDEKKLSPRLQGLLYYLRSIIRTA